MRAFKMSPIDETMNKITDQIRQTGKSLSPDQWPQLRDSLIDVTELMTAIINKNIESGNWSDD